MPRARGRERVVEEELEQYVEEAKSGKFSILESNKHPA
jgi:hypothetical protein